MLKEASGALFAICLLLASLEATATASEPQPDEPEPIVLADTSQILGHWQRGEGEAIIEISKHQGIYRGVIVWSQRRPDTVGVEVFRELRYDATANAWRGRAYSIKRKREVRIDIELLERDHLELTAHILFFTREVSFRRIPTAKIAALRAQPEL